MKKTKVAIIGSGPAGFTAATYAGRAMLEPVVLAGIKSGGQLMWTTDVENFPGFPEGVNGAQLMFQMRQQAERFGAHIQDVYATAVDLSQRPFKIWTGYPVGADPQRFDRLTTEELVNFMDEVKTQPHDIEAESVIIATGAAAQLLGIPGEEEFLGRGFSTCAVCDAAFYRDKSVYVIGGGDSAMEDTLALTKFAKEVTVIHRRGEFRASKIMQERVLNHPKVKVMWNTMVEEIMGDQKVTGIKINQDGKSQELSADGVFIAIGHVPATRIFQGQVEQDGHGYVVTRQSASALGVTAAQAATEDALVRFPTMTSVEGVFAAGDNVDVRYKQAITAAGQGCSAALDAERWLEAQGE
jgi:thioredoxin reductase (NADPH)